MTDIIASLKFSPGHFSHLLAWSKILKGLGRNSLLYLDKGYRSLLQGVGDIEHVFSLTQFQGEFDIALIYNSSIKNDSLICKLNRCKTVFVYHEPGITFNQRLKEGPSFFLKSAAASFLNKRIVKKVDKVLVPSLFAKRAYEQNEHGLNGNVEYFPLIFDDENRISYNPMCKRFFFSYIGTVAKAHDFDGFLKYMEFAYKNKLGTKFLIATRSKIGNVIAGKPLLTKMISNGQLEVIHGRPLSNEEINECFARSFCVWNLYRRSTQSGVLPKAFMFGTPVIASPIGSFPEFVTPGQNGEIISTSKNFQEISEALEKIKDSFERYSTEARKTFLDTFHYKANIERLQNIIADMKG